MWRVLPIAAAVVAGIAFGAIAVAVWRSPGAPRAEERVRFSISLADGIGIDDLTRAAVSPDGRLLALTEGVGNGRRVSALSLRDGSKRDLGEVAGPGTVCWSPDGQWLVYFGADRALYKVEVATGQRQRLAPLVWAPNAASWSVNGNIYVVAAVAETMVAVPSSGGEPREVVSTADAKSNWMSVQALPDGNRLLLSRAAGGEPEMVLATADGLQQPRVIGRGGYPAVHRSGLPARTSWQPDRPVADVARRWRRLRRADGARRWRAHPAGHRHDAALGDVEPAPLSR